MNNTARRIIMDRMNSDRRGRDYGRDYNDRDMSSYDRGYQDGRSYTDNAYQRGYRTGRDYGEDYAHDYGYEYTVHGGDSRRDYGDRPQVENFRRVYGEGNDYGKMKITRHDMEDIERMTKNADGSMGFHFDENKVRTTAERIGTDVNKYSVETFSVAMNMMYADYCNVAKKMGVDRPEFYAEMAKAFLDDKDYDGEPGEKMYTYYMCIMKKDE